MLSRIAESALAVARARVGAARSGRFNSKAFSTQISKSYAAPAAASPVNAFAQTWYKLYVHEQKNQFVIVSMQYVMEFLSIQFHIRSLLLYSSSHY